MLFFKLSLVTLSLTASPISAYFGCDFKCNFDKKQCILHQCGPNDESCIYECKQSFAACSKVCQGSMNICADNKKQCANDCGPFKGSQKNTCSAKCQQAFECCSLPKESALTPTETPTSAEVAEEDVKAANEAFTIAAMGSSLFQNFNENVCSDTCNDNLSLCRSECMFGEQSPDVCAVGCVDVQKRCLTLCDAQVNTCQKERSVCAKSCAGSGNFAERCANVCNSKYECCQMGSSRPTEEPVAQPTMEAAGQEEQKPSKEPVAPHADQQRASKPNAKPNAKPALVLLSQLEAKVENNKQNPKVEENQVEPKVEENEQGEGSAPVNGHPAADSQGPKADVSFNVKSAKEGTPKGKKEKAQKNKETPKGQEKTQKAEKAAETTQAPKEHEIMM